jgi:hypothetical protein
MRVRPVNPGRRASTRHRARRREASARRDHSQLDLVHFEFDESHACGLRWRKRARGILRGAVQFSSREKRAHRKAKAFRYQVHRPARVQQTWGIKSNRPNRLSEADTGAVCQRTRTVCDGAPTIAPRAFRTPVDGTAETARCSRRARSPRIASGVGRAARGPSRRLKITACACAG